MPFLAQQQSNLPSVQTDTEEKEALDPYLSVYNYKFVELKVSRIHYR